MKDTIRAMWYLIKKDWGIYFLGVYAVDGIVGLFMLLYGWHTLGAIMMFGPAVGFMGWGAFIALTSFCESVKEQVHCNKEHRLYRAVGSACPCKK